MRFPCPVIALLWRTHRRNRRLVGELAAARADLNETKGELAVAKIREKRWRRHASIASLGNERAERAVAFQAMSDDIADLPEYEPDRRFPRSLP